MDAPLFNKESILSKLRELMPYLKEKYHVSSLALFGSVARNEQTPESDIDLIVEFSQPIGLAFLDLADFLEEGVFKRKVDLVKRHLIREKYYQTMVEDLHYV
ncbi:MAG: hypothetical protein EBX41_02585 [Chitinophagia bacterium]|nr:hypothetical protein [Chitinophagia bacterium]